MSPLNPPHTPCISLLLVFLTSSSARLLFSFCFYFNPGCVEKPKSATSATATTPHATPGRFCVFSDIYYLTLSSALNSSAVMGLENMPNVPLVAPSWPS